MLRRFHRGGCGASSGLVGGDRQARMDGSPVMAQARAWSIAMNWDALKTVVVNAMELPAAERDAFLNWACGEDLELRREAEALVSCDSDGFLDLNEL